MSQIVNQKAANEYADDLCIDQIRTLDDHATQQQRMAVGIALVQAGASVLYASKRVKVNMMSLRKHAYREGLSVEARRERFAEQEDMAVRRAFEILEKALRKAEDMLEKDEMRPSEVVKLIQASTGILSAKLRWGAPDPPPPEPEKEKSVMEKILERLESGQKVSVSKEEIEKPVYEIAEVVDQNSQE